MTVTNLPHPVTESQGNTPALLVGSYKVQLVYVTAALAEMWLGHNRKNRKLRAENVTKYASDMMSGNWTFDGMPIRFSENDDLLDGQHRLAAIVATGKTVLMLVVYGLPGDAQDTMDTGAKRTVADVFNIHGKKNANALAATARLAWAWNEGHLKTSDSNVSGAPSTAALRDLVNSDPLIVWATGLAVSHRSDIPASPTALGFSAWLMARKDQELTREFVRSLAEMRTAGVGDPRFTLLKRLSTSKASRERLSSIEQAFLFIRAWNAWRAGVDLKSLMLGSTNGPSTFVDAV